MAISPNKSAYATMRGSFSKDGMSDFLVKTLTGSAAVDKIPAGGIAINRADKWDGKDAEPIVEEPDDFEDEL